VGEPTGRTDEGGPAEPLDENGVVAPAPVVDPIDEDGEETFPASDAPAHW
jgi:hypothetical protein